MFSRLTYYLSSVPTLLFGVQNLFVLLTLPFKKNELTEIKLRNGLRFAVRGLMDVWILKETCLDRDYESNSVIVEDGWTVIDIGAALGDFAIDVAVRNPQAKVFAVEPFLQSHELLKKNIALNSVANVKPLFVAVGADSGDGTLYTTGEAVQHTTLDDVGSHAEAEKQAIKFQTLADLFAEQDIERCDYLKIDCEGCEFEILLHTNADTLGKIKHICLEYHNGFTPHSHQDLIKRLEANGFGTKVVANPVHDYLGILYAWQP